MAKAWQKKERDDAKLFDGRPTPRSGGLWFAKADSKSDLFLIENKTSDKENFTIKGEVWDKIRREAIINSRTPLLSLQFGAKKTELVVIDKEDFLALLKTIESMNKMLKDVTE